MEVRAVEPDEWPLLRELRLAALCDSPDAFASTYAREIAFTDDVWRERTPTSAIAFVDGRAAGIAGCIANGVAAELVGLWVTPDARSRGAGRALVDWVIAAAAAAGCRTVDLWVAARNEPAIALYAKCGFDRTGDEAVLAPDRPLPIVRMSRQP